MGFSKVSVVMSVYNGERYLRESIESILNQTMPDLEFIIVDDGSTDHTYDVLKGYEGKDRRVAVLRNEINLGLAKSLNKGIREARAEYIARQDADDISMPRRLERQLDFLERHKDYCCLGTFYTIINHRGKIKYNAKLPTSHEQINGWLETVNPLCHGSVMFRKWSAEKVGLYPEVYKYSQDYAFWHVLAKHSKLTNLPEFLYRLRLHKEATGISHKQQQWSTMFIIKKDLGLLRDYTRPTRRFAAGEFFGNSKFFYEIGMKRLAINNFLSGLFYRFFAPSAGLIKEGPIGICMVTGSFYPEITGGGLQCKTLIDSFKDKNIRFFVLTTTRSRGSKDIDKPNIWIFRIGVGKMGFLDKLKATVHLIFVFLKLRRGVDIVHIHGFSDKTILVILLAKLFRKCIIQKMSSLGDDDPLSIKRRKFGRLKSFFFSKADIYISITPAMSKRFLDSKFPSSKLLTIPNGVDTERFRPAKDINEKSILRNRLNLPANSRLILFVGFFSKAKAPDILFEAYKRIRHTVKEDIRILFIGSTNNEYFETNSDLIKTIKNDIKDFGIEQNVIFVEKTLQMEKYYRAVDIFVLPSLKEGLPNALLEAMSTALPCIASDLEGIRDYVITHNHDGMLFTPGNLEDLFSQLVNLLKDEEFATRIGIEARMKVAKYFSIEKVTEQYSNIYKKLYYKS